MQNGALRPAPWATLQVHAEGEAGLMGIALAPDFATSKHVYVVGTFKVGKGVVNRVMRLTDRGVAGTEPIVVLDNIPSADYHAGDAVAFGPDGMLYIATGDARNPGNAADPKSLGGKILRLLPGGGIPPDNPTPQSMVYARGLRNVQGLAWDASGQLFATEHGPSAFPNERFRANHDELNAIRAGADYGWPRQAGKGGDKGAVQPLVDWTPSIAPSGLAVYSGDEFPAWRGSLFVGALKGKRLERVVVERDSSAGSGWRVTRRETVVEDMGRIRAVAMGPDGRLYFTTSNLDGRGWPGKGDDRVLRLVPKP
jgi:glucose/arabinose dehydrogenase